MNVHETEKLYALFELSGIAQAENAENADIIIFNTCCVREGAETRVIGNLGIVKKLKEKKPSIIVAVCGCMTQQKAVAEKLHKRCPFINIITGTYKLSKLPHMANLIANGEKFIMDLETDLTVPCGINEAKRSDNVNNFVNIMYGCNNFCTYCIVPYVKGRERSRRKNDIVEEVRTLIGKGCKEITLLGQNVNSYNDGNYNFRDLLDELSDLDGEFWIKFMTSHPKDLSNDVIDLIAKKEKLADYIHLPLQSGSDRILALMNRKYDIAAYMEKIDRIKEKMPDAGITSDIIVGFPTETEKDFILTEEAVQKVGYNNLFTFIYSKRTGTPAAVMEGQVPEETKKERIARLIALQAEIANKKAKECIGKTYRVLCDSKSDKLLTGKTASDRVIIFEGKEALYNKFVDVKVTQVKNSKLYGEAVN